MSYKILTKTGEENTNIDGARAENFNAGRKSGVLKGVLSECSLSTSGTSITIGTGELRLCGHRVVITRIETISILTTPSSLTKYSLIAKINVSNSQPTFNIESRGYPATLLQNNLYNNLDGDGVYEIELGTYEVTTSRTIENLTKTVNVLESTIGGDLSNHYTKAEVNSLIISTLNTEV